MLDISTVQISVAEKGGLTESPSYLDISVRSAQKSGNQEFAPTWDMVMGVKNRGITEQAFTRRYIAMMEQSYEVNGRIWEHLMNMDEVILACYCRPRTFCHRYLLRDILVELCGADYIEEIMYIPSPKLLAVPDEED